MKTILMIFLCFLALKSFSQSNDVMTEERSSDWIKITAVTAAARPKTTTTVRKKTSSKKSAAPKQDAQQEFEKTNSRVNRFKKSKKG